MRCNDPSLASFGDSENLEGLGGTGTRCGLAGIFSEVQITSEEETESTVRTKIYVSRL